MVQTDRYSMADFYFVYHEGQHQGPMPLEELQVLAKRGMMKAQSFVSRNGRKYHQAGLLPELSELLVGEVDPALITPPNPPSASAEHVQSNLPNEPDRVNGEPVVGHAQVIPTAGEQVVKSQIQAKKFSLFSGCMVPSIGLILAIGLVIGLIEDSRNMFTKSGGMFVIFLIIGSLWCVDRLWDWCKQRDSTEEKGA